jgi:hypothetical protein
MDHKPLLQERPPAYNLEAGQGDYACGPHGYGAIPTAPPPPPPPYPYLVTGGPGLAGPGRNRARGAGGGFPAPRRGHPLGPGLRRALPGQARPGCGELCVAGALGTGGRGGGQGGRSDSVAPFPLAPQGSPPRTPGSTTSTAGRSPGTPPTPSWSSEAARCAGESRGEGRGPAGDRDSDREQPGPLAPALNNLGDTGLPVPRALCALGALAAPREWGAEM